MSLPRETTSGSHRAVRRLKPTLERNILNYAITASATGVGLLALSQAAGASIVYTQTNQKITQTTFLDLNNDGTSDFAFSTLCTYFHSGSLRIAHAELEIGPQVVGNQIWGQDPKVAALAAGVKVGSNGPFKSDIYLMGRDFSSVYSGKWAPVGGSVKNRYVGLKFLVGGQIHFGWARLNVMIRSAQTTCVQAVLTGYAYETVPGKSIVTGKTSATETGLKPAATLGQLAMGAAGLVAWRRERGVAA